MKKLLWLLILFAGLFLVGCANDTADKADRELTDNQQEVYQVKQPLPFFDYSFERDMVTQIYVARNDALNTWSVWRSATGEIEDWCPSIGFGIPYDTQLTNPLKPFYNHNSSSTTVEQAEPNGLFSSKNTAATWVLCQLPNGDIAPVYIETRVTVYPWPIKVEDNKVVHLYEQGPSVVLETK